VCCEPCSTLHNYKQQLDTVVTWLSSLEYTLGSDPSGSTIGKYLQLFSSGHSPQGRRAVLRIRLPLSHSVSTRTNLRALFDSHPSPIRTMSDAAGSRSPSHNGRSTRTACEFCHRRKVSGLGSTLELLDQVSMTTVRPPA
jgi:hypothetical protein